MLWLNSLIKLKDLGKEEIHNNYLVAKLILNTGVVNIGNGSAHLSFKWKLELRSNKTSKF